MAYINVPTGGALKQHSGSATGTSPWINLAPANGSKGSWVEMVASTAKAADEVTVCIGPANAGTHLTDVGIGGAGSEVVLIPDILSRAITSVVVNSRQLSFPISVPAGTRLAMRGRANTSGTYFGACLLLRYHGLRGRPSGMTRVKTYGVSFPGGTAIALGGTAANTKGSWVQLVATTTAPIRRLLLGVASTESTAGPAYSEHRLDIGVGAAGSEVVVVPDLPVHVDDQSRGPITGSVNWVDVAIPAGVRLAVRDAASSTSNPARDLQAVLHTIG